MRAGRVRIIYLGVLHGVLLEFGPKREAAQHTIHHLSLVRLDMRGKGMGTVARVQVNLYVSERQRPNGLTLLCEVEHKGDNFVGFYRGSVVQYAFNVALQRL